MDLFDKETGRWVEAEIQEVSEDDFSDIHQIFSFDWSEEKSHKIYKLQLAEGKTILGLISLIDFPEEFRIQIHLLELLKENVGRQKRIDHIAGCLIAFACQQSFLKGYGGFVSLKPKTGLIEHYQTKYGFQQFGRQLAVDAAASLALIEKYL